MSAEELCIWMQDKSLGMNCNLISVILKLTESTHCQNKNNSRPGRIKNV
jgi:hypothetical protein